VIGLRGELKVLVASRPIDFRRGVHGLIAMVAQALGADPYCGNIFVFRSKRKDRLKMIFWDGTGMVLMTKWLEENAFTFPPIEDGAVVLTATKNPGGPTSGPAGAFIPRKQAAFDKKATFRHDNIGAKRQALFPGRQRDL
jgi:transposase